MLRTRLMLGLMLLLIILLSMGLYTISECSQLGKRIQAIGRDHDLAGRNLQEMKHSSGLMTAALLDGLTGNLPEGEQQLAAASAAFAKSLQEEQARPHKTPEEILLVLQVDAAFAGYQKESRALLADARKPIANTDGAAGKVGGYTTSLLEAVEKLNLAHEQAMTTTGRDGSRDINNTIRLIALLMIVALALTVAAWMGLKRGLVDPLQTLTASIQQVGAGNLDQKVPVLDNYELGTLARSFNQMAEQLKAYRANASVELMRLNQTVRSTLSSFPDPIFVLNSEGAVEFRNPEADQLAVQLLFAGVTRLPKQVDDQVEHVRKTGQDYLPTLFQQAVKFRLNGQDHYFLPRIVVLRDDDRKIFGVAVILEDITRMLLLDDVKSNLISTVSHELKTPLTSVRMALYLLFEKTVGELNPKQMDLVATAREDADRLLRTLNDLLDLAKLEQGPSQLNLIRSSPTDLVQEAVREARELGQADRRPFKVQIAPELPLVNVDRQRIAYVFSNLITNAVKYSPQGTDVLIRAGQGESRSGQAGVRFSVLNSGPGISLEHQEHIFERFYRVPGTRKSGAGLGLSIAREIVVAHQGEIGVISSPEDGSEFFFVLPFAPTEKSENGVAPDQAECEGSLAKSDVDSA